MRWQHSPIAPGWNQVYGDCKTALKKDEDKEKVVLQLYQHTQLAALVSEIRSSLKMCGCVDGSWLFMLQKSCP